MIRNRETEGEISLDFVPMVDVLFNLLIFFLLATSLKQAEREMHIALPFARADGPISAVMREIVVNVDAAGQTMVAGRPIDTEGLTSIIKQAVAGNPEQKVSVRGDRATSYANVVRVLEICKRSGVQQPYLDTVLEP